MDEIVAPYVIPLSAQKPKQLSLLPKDPGSRYKTRQLQVQIVGKSKMMKTMLVNILDVAKDMQVPPSYVGTFMGYEIGAQAKWDPKKPERQQAFLSGEHATKDLSRIALQFIQEVILCPNCNLPEIVTEVDQSAGKVLGRCRACGGFNELRISNEKFKRYILNHPPTTKGGSFSGAKNIKEKEAAVKKQVTKQNERDKAAEKAKEEEENPPQKERKKKEEAEVLRPKKLPEVEEVKAVLESADKLHELKTNSGVSDAEFIPVLFEALIPNDSSNVTALTKNKDLISKYLSDDASQIAFLRSLEKFYGEIQPTLVSKAAHNIKELYDEELVEEQNIFAWFEDHTNANQKVREIVTPLIKWFKEAEEESGSEGEED